LSGSAKYRGNGGGHRGLRLPDRLLQLTFINYALVAAF
jgi:hypothetical protein